MNDNLNSEIIINFTRNVWRICFPKYLKAPITLCYDPQSSITGTHYGLSHIAHDYLTDVMSDDPDNQIYTIDPFDRKTYPAGPHDLTTADIPNLPFLECILFVSYDNVENIQQVLEKLISNGIAIIINECIKLPKEWIPQNIKTEAMFRVTESFG